MSASRGYTVNDIQYGTHFHDINDTPPPIPRFSRIGLRSDDQEYRYPVKENFERRENIESNVSERSKFCSKQCLIGLAIGLAIGIIMVIVIAVPLGVVYRCTFGTISSTPNWVGTYQMDNGCDTSSCCCLTNSITVTKTATNQMRVSGSITGACTGFSSPVTLTQQVSTGFQVYLYWSSETIRLQLGPDSSYLSFVNIYHGTCSATAVRTSANSAIMKNMNMSLIMSILLITIGIMKL